MKHVKAIHGCESSRPQEIIPTPEKCWEDGHAHCRWCVLLRNCTSPLSRRPYNPSIYPHSPPGVNSCTVMICTDKFVNTKLQLYRYSRGSAETTLSWAKMTPCLCSHRLGDSYKTHLTTKHLKRIVELPSSPTHTNTCIHTHKHTHPHLPLPTQPYTQKWCSS